MFSFTEKGAIAEALDDLSPENFRNFCFQSELRDRRAEPRVSLRDVERKTRREVTEVLVSRFTESRAPLVAVETLRQINCNQEAEILESTIKAWEELENCTIQFGKHEGKTFKWLRENDVGYIVYVVASHMKEKESFSKQDPRTPNKDDLAKYAMSHPEIQEQMRQDSEYKKAKERSLQPGQQGAALVGFGPDPWETLQDLYESEDPEKIRFVKYILSKQSTCKKGSKMETAVKYFLQRDTARARPANVTTGDHTTSTTKSRDRFLKKEGKNNKEFGARKEKHFVDKHQIQLIDRVSNIESILDQLRDKGVILPERYDEIRALPTSQEKMRKIIFDCLKAGPASKDIFYKILEEKEKLLIEDLKENY